MIFYKRLTSVNAISFDLDDTLYDNYPVIARAQRSLDAYIAEHFPLAANLPNTFWRQQRQQALNLKPQLQHDMSALRLSSLTLGFLALGMSHSQAEQAAQQCYQYFYAKRSDFTVRPEVQQVLASLAAKVPLVAITNGNVCLKRVGIEQYFSLVYQANVALPMKPERQMFDQAQSALGIPASQILHVGDDLHKDVFGALGAGYQAAWYADNRPMQLTDEYTLLLPHVQLSNLQDLLAFA